MTAGATTPTWPALLAHDVIEARRSITLTSLSLLIPGASAGNPFAALFRCLVAAAARGVRVEIFLAAPSKAHPATAQNATMARRAHDQGVIVCLVPGPRLLHAKTALLDGRVAWAGSGNLTAAASTHNHEFFLRTCDQDAVAQLSAFHTQLRGRPPL